LDNLDRELQIELAKLQSDIQINLSIGLGVAGIFIALVISFQQLYVNATNPIFQSGFLSGMITTAIVGVAFAWFFAKRMYDKREEMEKLKKEYVF
jgi:hypothetical protein